MKKAIAMLTALLTISASVQAISRSPTDSASRQPRASDKPLTKPAVTHLPEPATPLGGSGDRDQRIKGPDGRIAPKLPIPDGDPSRAPISPT